jgi:hypothetical protein
MARRFNGAVAQMDRADASEASGREFEPRRSRHCSLIQRVSKQKEAPPSLTVQPAASLRPSMLLLLDASGFVATPAHVVIRF